MTSDPTLLHITDEQSQKVATAYFSRKDLLPFRSVQQ